MTEHTLATLAERFRRFNFENPEPESFQVWFKNNNSFGNRKIDWKGVWAKRELTENETALSMEDVYERIQWGACDWRHLFEGIHYGLIAGPKTLAAVEECLEILRADVPPEDDGTKVHHVNRLGGVNYVDKPTFHKWELTDKLGKIMSSAFFEDRKDKTLYSNNFFYVYDSYSGWNRAS
jgi:hypothetical protein